MAVVVLDPSAFRSSYPEFAGLTDGQVTTDWTMAQQLCDNTDDSIIQDVDVRAACLYALTAHFAVLMGQGTQGAARSGLVGRIASATQGSVNVSLEMPTNPDAAFFMQTQYGAIYWQLTGPYRTFLYAPGPVRNIDPYRPW